MNNINNKYLAVGAIVVVGIVLLIGAAVYKHYKSPAYQTTSVNPDTGQTIVNTPNVSPEKGGSPGQVVILGDDKFLNSGMTQAQFALSEKILTGYINTQLHDNYQQLTILNAGYQSSVSTITCKMRLGASSKLVKLVVNFHDLSYVTITVSDPTGDQKYSYNSGEQSAPAVQPNDTLGTD